MLIRKRLGVWAAECVGRRKEVLKAALSIGPSIDRFAKGEESRDLAGLKWDGWMVRLAPSSRRPNREANGMLGCDSMAWPRGSRTLPRCRFPHHRLFEVEVRCVSVIVSEGLNGSTAARFLKSHYLGISR